MCMRFELTPERLRQIEAKVQRRLRHPRPKDAALRNYLDDEDEPPHDELKYDDKGFCIEDGRLRRYNGDDDAVSIPDGVTEIGGGAFLGCLALASVSIPASVTIIGNGAFIFCKSLTEIRYGGTTEQWKAVEKGGDLNAGGPAQQVICTDGNAELE